MSVKDLAIMHFSISSAEGRENVHRRYQTLVEAEFRYPALAWWKGLRAALILRKDIS